MLHKLQAMGIGLRGRGMRASQILSRWLSAGALLGLICVLPGLLPSALAQAAKAIPQTSPPPSDAKSRKIEFIEYELPNGLHVILHQDRSLPVVASYVLYHVGSKDERADRTGFAHFFEHLMFEGSDNIPRGQIDKLVSGAGGNLNASTSFDQTDYFLNLPSNQLKLALWIESERMLHAKIDETGVETQRQVVKEERRLRYDNQPFGTLFEELAKMVFAGTNYEWVPIGSTQYIDQAKIEEFRDFYKTYYVPNNATLALAGDFDLEEAKKLIAEYFGPIPRGKVPPRPALEIKPQTEPSKVVVNKGNTPLPASLHAWRAPKETDPDSYAVDMMADILASGKSSRLYRRLVDKEQAAVQAQAFPFLLEEGGMVGVFAVGNRGVSLDQLDTLMDEEVARLVRDGVTDDELQKARNAKETQLAGSYGSMASRARGLARYHVFYGDSNLVNTEINNYLKVTKDDVQRVAKKYLTPGGRNVLHYPVPEAPKPAGATGGK
jgi:zinc protease